MPLRSVAALVASFMFGQAILLNWGGYSDPAVTWVILGVLVVGALFWSTRRDEPWVLPVRFLGPVIWLGLLAISAHAAWLTEPLLYAQGPWTPGQQLRGAATAVIFTYGLTFAHPEARWVRHVRFAAIAVLVALMGVQVVRLSPAPLIDVWTVQQDGARAFLEGRNPFQDVHQADTGPRTAHDVPYVYPPLHLYVSSVAWALLGDVRYGVVLALIILGALTRALALKASRGLQLPAILEDAPALIIWCTPMLPFLVEQAWIDPVQLCWCGAFLLAWDRPWLVAVAAGFVLGAKQTMLLMVLPVALALRFSLRQWLVVGVVAAIPVLPWLLWDFAAYKHANFDFLNALPVRDDALTVVVWAGRRLHLKIPWAVGFFLAATVIAIAGRRGRQSVDRAAITVVTALTFFFAFNKWAFANYYFTLLSLAALAAVASLGVRKPLVGAA